MSRRRLAGAFAGLLLACMTTWPSGTPGWADVEASPAPGWLGISISDVGEELADRLAMTFGPGAGTGVVVVDVLKGGPAERTPLKRGDIIVQVDAQPIWDVRQLQRTIRARPIHQRVMVTVLREASRITLPVTIGPMPMEARAQLAGERFGFLVRDTEERDPRRAQPEATGRIFVAFVDSDSPASRAGLRPQDLILRANDHPVGSLEDFERAMRGAERALSLLVERRGAQQPLTLKLELPGR
jgi:S1-C subfamily serine protease